MGGRAEKVAGRRKVVGDLDYALMGGHRGKLQRRLGEKVFAQSRGVLPRRAVECRKVAPRFHRRAQLLAQSGEQADLRAEQRRRGQAGLAGLLTAPVQLEERFIEHLELSLHPRLYGGVVSE